MGREQDRRVLFSAQLAHQLHDGRAVLGIKVSGRLVGHHDARAMNQSTGDGGSLLLSPRKLGGEVGAAVVQTDPVYQVSHTIRIRPTGQVQWQSDVFLDRQMRHQVERLEDDPDVLATQLQKLRLTRSGEFDSAQLEAARIRDIHGGDQGEQGRLAASTGTDHRDPFAPLGFEGDPAEGVDFLLTAAKDAVDVLEQQHACQAPFVSRAMPSRSWVRSSKGLRKLIRRLRSQWGRR